MTRRSGSEKRQPDVDLLGPLTSEELAEVVAEATQQGTSPGEVFRRQGATLAAITVLATAALAERRRGCPTYGLVRAADIQAIVEEAK